MKKATILTCLILLLSEWNAQPTDALNKPKNDSFEAVVETEREPEPPKVSI